MVYIILIYMIRLMCVNVQWSFRHWEISCCRSVVMSLWCEISRHRIRRFLWRQLHKNTHFTTLICCLVFQATGLPSGFYYSVPVRLSGFRKDVFLCPVELCTLQFIRICMILDYPVSYPIAGCRKLNHNNKHIKILDETYIVWYMFMYWFFARCEYILPGNSPTVPFTMAIPLRRENIRQSEIEYMSNNFPLQHVIIHSW